MKTFKTVSQTCLDDTQIVFGRCPNMANTLPNHCQIIVKSLPKHCQNIAKALPKHCQDIVN